MKSMRKRGRVNLCFLARCHSPQGPRKTKMNFSIFQNIKNHADVPMTSERVWIPWSSSRPSHDCCRSSFFNFLIFQFLPPPLSTVCTVELGSKRWNLVPSSNATGRWMKKDEKYYEIKKIQISIIASYLLLGGTNIDIKP